MRKNKWTAWDVTFIELGSITAGIVIGVIGMLWLAYCVAMAPAADLDSQRPAFIAKPKTITVCVKDAGCWSDIKALDEALAN